MMITYRVANYSSIGSDHHKNDTIQNHGRRERRLPHP